MKKSENQYAKIALKYSHFRVLEFACPPAKAPTHHPNKIQIRLSQRMQFKLFQNHLLKNLSFCHVRYVSRFPSVNRDQRQSR